MNAPEFSIIVPVYNTIVYLSDCVSSILSQDFQSFELILVDDGSTDGSADMCDELAAQDRRVLCVHKLNGGVSSARNAGIEVAQGQYVWFCDSDDQICSGALRKLAQALSQSSDKPLMVAFPVEQIDGDGNRLGLIPAPKSSVSSNEGPLQCGDLLFPYAHVFQRSLIGDERFDTTLALLEDRDFLYKMFWKAAGSVAVIDEPLYRYLITREDSAVNSASVAKYVDATAVQDRILRNEISLGHPSPAFELFASHSIGVLSMVARLGSRPGDYELLRNRLLVYRNYLSFLHGATKAKYLLIVHFPVIFNVLTRAYGMCKSLRGNRVGSTVLIKE
ncbi:MAG: glycosyltransferase [Collinsella sp.]|nr:glycosyltransferase [Collinsella sp.]MDU6507940.1 glycosyltransferase [Collinsella sp.]